MCHITALEHHSRHSVSCHYIPCSHGPTSHCSIGPPQVNLRMIAGTYVAV